MFVFLGAFLVALALIANFYAADQVKRTPLDTDSVTRLEGKASVFDGKKMVDTPVKASSTTLASSEDSTKDVVVFHNSSCLVKDTGDTPDCVSAADPKNRLIAASTDVFAAHRRTGLAVNNFDGLPADAEEKSGLINKFPFDVEKKTYPFWDSYVGMPIDATFEGVEQLKGLETYKFTYLVEGGDIEIGGAPGEYDTEKTMWIDPVTGAIQDQHQKIVQRMADGQEVIDLDFKFTEETVAANVKSAKESGDRLALIGSTVPLVAGFLGLALLVAGLVLFLLGRRSRTDVRNDGFADTRGDDYDADVFGTDQSSTRRTDLHGS
ncbi:hypothetical protein AWH69_12470 [Janibacter melonis]|uniref:DUF3068 domain-containing protein n=1 Tax=Janibacter melonis TaxID=262209 RepID=A0A176QBQ0_9MICO|nr:DUF3068 domain-containing protein [Janibacter melonis]OAB87162.1 hypothetical protein AWH69_12470 [Janibacter melonis]